MRNVSNKSCRENQNKHFVFSNYFKENRSDYETMWKSIAERGKPQMTVRRMRIACWITNATHTLTICSTYGFSTVKGKGKGRFTGLFQHCGRSAYCILTTNKFSHSSPEAPRIIQTRETSTSEGGNYYQ